MAGALTLILHAWRGTAVGVVCADLCSTFCWDTCRTVALCTRPPLRQARMTCLSTRWSALEAW
jgi:hypothetical protein